MRYVTSPFGTSVQGFGDQMSRVFFNIIVAEDLDAVPIAVQNFYKITSTRPGAGVYVELMSTLGFSEQPIDVTQLRSLRLSYGDQLLLNNTFKRSCNVLFEVDAFSCTTVPAAFCLFNPKIAEKLEDIRSELQMRTLFHSSCSEKHTVFSKDHVNVLIHLRSTDASVDFTHTSVGCLNCSISYWYRVGQWLIKLLNGLNSKLYFASQRTLPSSLRDYLLDNFPNVHFLVESSNFTLPDLACHLLNADVVIATGSSLPTSILMFADGPIILEERNYISTVLNAPVQYSIPGAQSFRLDNGSIAPMHSIRGVRLKLLARLSQPTRF